jgi:GAF domain-containing protein
LLRGEDVIGLLILDHVNPGAFDDEATDLLSSVAAQASVAIHNARLYQQAQARSAQLQTAAEVSRAASSILDPNPLIEQTVNLIRNRFDLYYVGLFIVDDSGAAAREPGKWAILRAGTGDAGRIQLERAHKLEIGGASMIGQCIATSQAQISQQIDSKDQRFVNPLLPDTRSEMALPLISRGQVTGAMTIQSTEPSAFSDEDITILQTMADQVANALQNASLFDQTQIRAEELAVLNEMSRQLTSSVDIAEITRNLYLFTSRLIDTSTFFIALYDKQTDSLTFPFASEENQEIHISGNVQSQGLTKYVIDNREPVLISENVDAWLENQDLDTTIIGSDEQGIQTSQSWLGVPMLAGDEAIGIINVQHRTPHHYHEQDYDLLMAIASQGAIAYQNARLFAETRQRTEDLVVLNDMSREMASLLDIDRVLRLAYDYTSKLMDTTYFFIALYDAKTDELALPFIILKNEFTKAPSRKLGKGLSDYVVRTKKPLLLNGDDVLLQLEEIGVERVALGEGLTPKSWLGIPMMIGGEVIGVINVQSVTTPYLYQERQHDLLISIGSQLAITIQNIRLFDQSQQQLSDLNYPRNNLSIVRNP